jgi:hypothetical protein
MFAKLAALIIGIALTAGALLAARQVRTQAAHELAQARIRVMRLDHERLKIRAQIAERIAPDRIQEMASRLTPLKPIAGEFPAPPLPSPPATIARVPDAPRPDTRR